ncbi:hypothetical protein CV102_06095 [Natronococcus pandeyae]|uniref:DUF4013 domain-containing protein n=1 Tax=Natronococcus pandeyae TaxID=2055836 RepID=A0A8J8TTG1_9EURY|nr:hypothetical protein [Natronococcus pandeyae]TYL39849.1 hypothetical protein CV102_06095 [Natronococcus pandeyae]
MDPDHAASTSGPGPGGRPGSEGLPGTPRDERPHSFPWHVSRVLNRFGAILSFALVPLLTSLFPLENVARALEGARGMSINLEFALPTPLLDLWTFADPPEPTPGTEPRDTAVDPGTGIESRESTASSGGQFDLTVDTPLETVVLPLEGAGLEIGAWLAFVLVAYAAVAAVLAAVYVGGLDRRLRGEPAAVPTCVAAYGPRFFAYNLLVYGAVAALVPFVLLSPTVLLLAFPALVLLAYLFYAVPFLFVVADAGVLEAFRRSYGFAVGERTYLTFALWHVGVAVVSSLVLSLSVSAGGAGFLFALVVAVPLALVLTAASVSFVRELVETEAVERRA